MGTTICSSQERKMSKIIKHEKDAYLPEELLPEEARNWARYQVGTTRARIDSWRTTKVTLWRTGDYAFYCVN